MFNNKIYQINAWCVFLSFWFLVSFLFLSQDPSFLNCADLDGHSFYIMSMVKEWDRGFFWNYFNNTMLGFDRAAFYAPTFTYPIAIFNYIFWNRDNNSYFTLLSIVTVSLIALSIVNFIVIKLVNKIINDQMDDKIYSLVIYASLAINVCLFRYNAVGINSIFIGITAESIGYIFVLLYIYFLFFKENDTYVKIGLSALIALSNGNSIKFTFIFHSLFIILKMIEYGNWRFHAFKNHFSIITLTISSLIFIMVTKWYGFSAMSSGVSGFYDPFLDLLSPFKSNWSIVKFIEFSSFILAIMSIYGIYKNYGKLKNVIFYYLAFICIQNFILSKNDGDLYRITTYMFHIIFVAGLCNFLISTKFNAIILNFLTFTTMLFMIIYFSGGNDKKIPENISGNVLYEQNGTFSNGWNFEKVSSLPNTRAVNGIHWRYHNKGHRILHAITNKMELIHAGGFDSLPIYENMEDYFNILSSVYGINYIITKNNYHKNNSVIIKENDPYEGWNVIKINKTLSTSPSFVESGSIEKDIGDKTVSEIKETIASKFSLWHLNSIGNNITSGNFDCHIIDLSSEPNLWTRTDMMYSPWMFAENAVLGSDSFGILCYKPFNQGKVKLFYNPLRDHLFFIICLISLISIVLSLFLSLAFILKSVVKKYIA